MFRFFITLAFYNQTKFYGNFTTCPVITGIFLRIVSEVAYEDFLNGEKNITPFWRVVDHESKTASKLACGFNFLKKRRREENIN